MCTTSRLFCLDNVRSVIVKLYLEVHEGLVILMVQWVLEVQSQQVQVRLDQEVLQDLVHLLDHWVH